MNGSDREALADSIRPWLVHKQRVSLPDAREQLRRHVRADQVDHLDGMAVAWILRRAGFTRDYFTAGRTSWYVRRPA